MDEEFQFPEVVELNVGGCHFTTLLSTLTKEKDSILADMFSGNSPVYKDRDGRYFLDGDGKLFPHILDYLRADIMPFQGTQNHGFGFGAGFGNAIPFDKMVVALHKEAKLFGLKELSNHLEQYKALFIERQLETFRNSKPGYKDCVAEIVNSVPVRSMLGSSRTVIVLVENGDRQRAKCCDHSCKFNYPSNNLFRQSQVSQDDVGAINVPFEVDHTVLNCLYLDLMQLGFSVNCGISECNFWCEKASKNVFGSVAFGNKTQRQCCKEPVHYIQLNWLLAPNQSLFGNQGFSFGGGAAAAPFSSKGGSSFGFGSQEQSGTFGSPQSNTGQCGLFGSQQSSSSQGGLFGSQQSNSGQSGVFGSPQSGFGKSVFGGPATLGQSSFGGFGGQSLSNQSSGFSFGQTQQNDHSAFASGSSPGPAQSNSSFSFGSTSTQQQDNEKSTFGGVPQANQSAATTGTGGKGFTFGTPHNFGQTSGDVKESGNQQEEKSFGFGLGGLSFRS